MHFDHFLIWQRFFNIIFLWREYNDNSVFLVACLIDVCFLIIIDCTEIFLSTSQLAVGNDM